MNTITANDGALAPEGPVALIRADNRLGLGIATRHDTREQAQQAMAALEARGVRCNLGRWNEKWREVTEAHQARIDRADARNVMIRQTEVGMALACVQALALDPLNGIAGRMLQMYLWRYEGWQERTDLPPLE